jgi:hypothetical protein
MEVSTVRQRVLDVIGRAKRVAADRRERSDEAGREYELFLDRIAIPLFKQVANILRAEGYQFNVFTPGGSVRLMSDRAAEDYAELTLDTTGDIPKVIGHTSRSRGRRVVETEEPLNPSGPVRDLTEDSVLAFLLKAMEPFVER